MPRHSYLLICAALLPCVMPLPLVAQFDSGSIVGSVRDAHRAAIPGVRIQLRNLATGVAEQTTSSSSGDFQFPMVRIGRYQLEATAPAFQTATADGVEVEVGARKRVDFALAVSTVQSAVDVTASSTSVVEADTSDRGQVVAGSQVVDLPLDGRNYSDLAWLTAGMRKSDMADSSSPREGSFNVNGMRSSVNNFMLDGVDNNSYSTSNQGFSNQIAQPAPDAIVEFKVQTNNMSAEFGRSGGATINVALKSGTNAFHGSAWEFYRNTALNAVGFFKPTDNVKPTINRNQFGFTAGGPIRKNKTFYFADYEGFRLVQATYQLASIPTLIQRTGNVGSTVLNPFTGASYSGGKIPASELVPFAMKVLNDLPLPDRGITTSSNNYGRLVPENRLSDKGDAKIDQYWNSRWNSFVRLSQLKEHRTQPGIIPGPSGGNGNGYVHILAQSLAVGTVFIASPTSIFEARLGITRQRGGKSPLTAGGPSLEDVYGIPGFTTDERVRGGLNSISIGGFSQLGRQSTNPQWQYPTVVDPRLVYSGIAGRHSLKAGAEFQAINEQVEDVNPLYGLITYAGTFSRPATATATAVYDLADFLMGAPSQIAVTNLVVAELRTRMYFAYLQDDWKVNSRLTLNLGVRYEFATPTYEAGNKLSNYNPATNRIDLAGAGSLYNRSLVHPDYKNWAPRIGLAYTPAFKTAIRAGYGISYTHFTRGGDANLLAFNGPQSVQVSIEQQPGQAGYLRSTAGIPTGITSPQNFDQTVDDVKWIPQDTHTGYVQSWFFSIQKEIARQTLLDVAYVGNHSVKQVIYYDFNQAAPNLPGKNLTVDLRRPDRQFSSITAAGPDGFSTYNALQVRLERRSRGGLYLLNSFTWSKAIDNATDALETGNGDTIYPQNSHNFAGNKALSLYNQPWNDVATIVWELPFGRGRRWGSAMPGSIDTALGGWRLGIINNMWGSQPVNLTWTVPPQFQLSSDATLRPNVLGPVMLPADQRTAQQSFIVANVVIPKDPSQPFGSAGRNIAKGFPYFGSNLSLQKEIRLRYERMRLQIRSEAFNILNHTNFNAPSGSRSATTFGAVSSTKAARQLQFGAKLIW